MGVGWLYTALAVVPFSNRTDSPRTNAFPRRPGSRAGLDYRKAGICPALQFVSRPLLVRCVRHSGLRQSVICKMPARSSGSMYAPYRGLGQVCDGAQGGGAAPTVHRRGKTSFLTAPVSGGRALHIYDTSLHLKGVSQPLPNGTTAGALAAADDYVFVAAKSGGVHVLRLMRFVCTWGADIGGVVTSLLVVGGSCLVAVLRDVGRVVVWRIPTHRKSTTPNEGEVLSDVALPVGFKATVVAHPPTYLNKILLGADDGRLLLLNIRTQKTVHVFPGFQSPVMVLAPSPVVDVVAVGTNDGRIVLHNIRMDESICTLRHGLDMSLDGDEGFSKMPRTAGDAVVSSESDESADDEDVKMGALVPKSASVSVISFCTDGSETVVTGDAIGNLAVWSLNDQALTAVARGVHAGGIAFAEFLPGEALLVTAGVADNAIKVHVFDGPTRNARVLRSREGHRLPPTRVRFSGRNARMLVSAGLDREVRIVSAVQDAQNRSFSQKNISRASARVRKRRRASAGVQDGAAQQLSEGARRLPVVTGIATVGARHRDKDFANVVTIHAGRREAYTWRAESGAMHRLVLRPPKPPQPLKLAFQRGQTSNDGKPAAASRKEARSRYPSDGTVIDKRRAKSEASAVIMSHCGNFALLGLSNGEVHSFNLQSGIHHGAFVADANYRAARTRPSEKLPTWGRAHGGRVTGLAVDACGDVFVSAGCNSLRFWNLRTREPLGEVLELPACVTSVIWSKASDLLAVICEDFGVYIYDTGTRKLARRLLGHSGAITDASFDSEGRRVVTSSMDGSIKTWDLPSGRAIDTLRCETAPTSVAVGPGGEFIASCHVNSLSVSLWVDRSKFGGAHRSWVRTANDSDSEAESDSESASDVDVEKMSIAEAEDAPAEGSIPDEGHFAVVSSLGSDLITLSGRPTTQWTTLANLDAIKQRNKPIQLPKKPEQLPFFLPTVKGITPKFDIQAVEERSKAVDEKAVVEAEAADVFGEGGDFFGNSQFGYHVCSGNFVAAAKLLSGLGPSGVDMELRTLEGAQSRLGAAHYFLHHLESRRDFEIIQAQLDVFLKTHGRDLACDHGGAGVLVNLARAQDDAWSKLRHAFDSVLTLTSHFAGHV